MRLNEYNNNNFVRLSVVEVCIVVETDFDYAQSDISNNIKLRRLRLRSV